MLTLAISFCAPVGQHHGCYEIHCRRQKKIGHAFVFVRMQFGIHYDTLYRVKWSTVAPEVHRAFYTVHLDNTNGQRQRSLTYSSLSLYHWAKQTQLPLLQRNWAKSCCNQVAVVSRIVRNNELMHPSTTFHQLRDCELAGLQSNRGGHV